MDTTSQTISAQRGHVQALAFARKGGAALSALVGSIATRKEAERLGPCEVFLFLEQHFTDDEKGGIPVVGSKQGETGNKPYDKYTAEVQTADGKKKVPGSWYTDVIKATDEYAIVSLRKQWCDDVSFVSEDGQKCPEDIVNMGTGERAVEKKRLSNRVSDMRTGLTRGAMLWHHAEEIMTLNPDRIKVKMPFRMQKNVTTGESEMVAFGSMIRLQDPLGEIEDKVLSVSQFNALRPAKLPVVKDATDPDKLDKTGWTTSALEKTAERAPKGTVKGSKGATTIAVPTTVEGVLNLMNILATAIDGETEQGSKVNSMLLSACATPGAKGDDTVETIGDFALNIDAIWSTIDKRYNNIKAAKAAAMNTKAVKAA